MTVVVTWLSRLPDIVLWLFSFAMFIILAIIIFIIFSNKRRTVGWICAILAIYSILVSFTFHSFSYITNASYANPVLAMFDGFFEVMLMFLNPRDFSQNQEFINKTPWLTNSDILQAVFWSSQVTARLATHIFVVFLFGKKLIDSIRIRLFWRLRFFRIKEVCIILGSGKDALALGEDLYQNSKDIKISSVKRLILFLINDNENEKNVYEKASAFGGIVRVLDTKEHCLDYYFRKAGLATFRYRLRHKLLSLSNNMIIGKCAEWFEEYLKTKNTGTSKRLLKHKVFLMPDDLSADDRVVEISKIASDCGVSDKSTSFDIYLITSSEWTKENVIDFLKDEIEEDKNKIKYTCHLIDETDLLIRTQMIKKHPPVECPGLGFMEADYDKSGKSKKEFTVMILGFRKVGQRALMHLIMNGQFVCDNVNSDPVNMRAIIVESHALQNVEGFIKRVPGLDLCCRIETENVEVPSKELSMILQNNLEKIDYIVIALDEGELNRFAAGYLSKYYQSEGIAKDRLPYIAVFDKNWMPLNDGDKPEDDDERIFRFGCRDILYKEKVILRTEQDKRAKKYSSIMHKKRKWSDLDYYTQEGYRSLAEFFDSMLILFGEKESTIWKKAGFFHMLGGLSEVLMQTEHLRWSAFYTVSRGYRELPAEEMSERFYDSKSKPPFDRLKYTREDGTNKRHARLVSWGKLFDAASNKYIELSNEVGYRNNKGFRYYLESPIKGIPLIPFATADDEEIKRRTEKAEEGNKDDQFFIACYYLHYLQDEADNKEYAKKVFSWFQDAEADGNVDAKWNLSQCYYKGYGIEKDDEKGKKLWSEWKSAI